MAENDPGTDPGTEWLTIAAAARRLGVTPRAIRGRIRRGTIEWQPHGNSGRLVRVTAADVPRDDPETDPPDELDELRAELQDALVAQARAEERALMLRELADRLTAELADARRELAEARRPWWRRLTGR